jgi:NADPH-dependent ferric siderophore reductase
MSPAATAVTRPFPLCTGIATVTARRPLTPLMARFTLSAPPFADLGVEEPGEIITLGWSPEGEELVLPEQGWRFRRGREQHWRNFTVRDYRPEQAEIDVDFFLHGDLGIASAWAGRAVPGDTVGYAGPRVHFAHDPAADWSLLVADETGLPALLAIAESLPAGHPVVALAEIHDDGERQHVDCAAALDVRWASRDGRPAGTTTVLADALATLDLPDGTPQVWGGGEALAMRSVRDGLRGAGVPRAAMNVLGYWKHRSTPEDVEY